MDGTWKAEWSERGGDNVGFEEWKIGPGKAYERTWRGEIRSKNFLTEEQESGKYEIKGDHILFHADKFNRRVTKSDGTVRVDTSRSNPYESGFKLSGNELTIWAVGDPSQSGTMKRVQ